MTTYPVATISRGLGIVSLFAGGLGLVFYWWVPFGIVLGLAGLTFGCAGWIMAPHQPRVIGLALAGLFLSTVALLADVLVALGGTEAVKFSAFH
jgi:hypothetical protein